MFKTYLQNRFRAQSRGALWASLIRLTSVLLAFVSMVLIARALGSAGYGLYAGTLSIAVLATYFTKLGAEPQLVRDVAAYSARADHRHARGIVLFCALSSALLCVMVIAVLMALAVYTPRILGPYADTLTIAALAIPALSIIAITQSALRGLMRFVIALVPRFIIAHAVTLGLVVLLLAVNKLSPLTALWAAAAAFYCAALFGLVSLWLALPSAIKGASAAYQPRPWLRGSASMMLGSINVLLIGQADIVLVGLLSEPSEAGRYAAGLRIATLLSIPVLSVNAGLSPLLAGLFARHEQARIQQRVSGGARTIFVAAVLMAAALAVAGPALFAFLGRDFGDAYLVFIALGGGLCLSFVFGHPYEVLLMAGRTRIAVLVSVGGVVVNGAADVLLIPSYGAMGAALATAVAIPVQSAILAVVAFRLLGLRCDIFARRPAAQPAGRG